MIVFLTPDFKVNPATNEAYISIRKTAELINTPATTLRRHLDMAHPNYDRKQGLTPEIFKNVLKNGALNGNPQAIDLLEIIADAGLLAFFYKGAGLSIGIQTTRPLTQLETYEELVRMEKTRLALLDTVTKQTDTISVKQIKTDDSSDFFTIRRIRALNQGVKIDPKILMKACTALELMPDSVFDLYEQRANSYHRLVWEEAYPDVMLP